MIEKLNSFKVGKNKKLFELIDDFDYKELQSFIQNEDNEIWNIFIEDNKNCLHYTCERGNEKMIVFIITQLKIRLGINPDFNNIYDDFNKKLNIFKYFMNSKSKKEGYTPLHYAILSFDSCIQINTQQNINIIYFLLSNFADPKIKTNLNQNVLHLCAISSNTNGLVLFKEKYQLDINEKDSLLKTPLHYCTEKDNYDILNILINYENIEINCIDKEGNTPLHYSVYNEHQRAIKKLIQYHSNINIKNKNKKTPLQLGLNSINNNIKKIFTKKTILEQLFFEQTIKKGETNIYKMIFFFLIHFFSIFLNYFLLMPCYTNRSSIISILYIISTFIIFIYYFILFYSDPGYQDNSNSHYSNLLEVLEDKKDVINYCPITFIILKDNSKFCLICRKYIQGFNHHCYWVGNCIGEKNFNKFLVFIVLCIVNIGYNLLLIIIYFLSGFLSKFFNLNRGIITYDKENDFYVYHSILNEQAKGLKYYLMKGIRGCLGLIGMFICFVFVSQLIELFKYHYNAMKEKNKNKKKKLY